ncbi:DUF6705 family protein [Chryseobacterium aquaticum]|uniref:DUF6705 family protein n=1 Tax=Chryseobacterium aquaticum TaxID=452084 RepID=UPI002FC81D8A
MKNLIILLLVFVSHTIFSQKYPLKTSSSDVVANGYIKDLNNEYGKYIGLWKGQWNGKTIYIELKKVKVYRDGNHPYYIDKILGERKIIDANGNVELDRITNFDYQHPEIWGLGFPTGYNNMTYQSLMFYPKNMCDMDARLVITNITPTQMTLHLHGMMGYPTSNCVHDAYVQQHGEWPINFPKDIVLTKQ